MLTPVERVYLNKVPPDVGMALRRMAEFEERSIRSIVLRAIRVYAQSLEAGR